MNRQQRRLTNAEGARLQKLGWSRWESHPLVSPFGHPAPEGCFAVWKNNLYIVLAMFEPNGITRLQIRPNDGQPTRSWQHLQRIKNELMGPERVAVEVFPAVSELVDDANIYHLWVLPEGARLPFRLER